MQCLLSQPMLLWLWACRRLRKTHVRHRHLGNIQQPFDAIVFRHGSGIHRRFEGGGRHRHAEGEALATCHDAADIAYLRELACDDFGTKCGKDLGSIVVASDHRSDRDPFPPQELNDVQTYRSHVSCGSGHEHGACDGTRVMCYGRHTLPKIAALPLPLAGQIDIRPRLFPPCEESIPLILIVCDNALNPWWEGIMAGRFEGLSDLEWNLFADIFPPEPTARRRVMPHTPFRKVVNTLL